MLQSRDDIPSNPKLGIFWGVFDGHRLRLAIDSTEISKAEAYGELLTHPRGHYEVWEEWRTLGPRHLKKLNLPMLILSIEYESLPRGRIVYDQREELYIIYADRKLQAPSIIDDVVMLFDLRAQRYAVRSDAHYVS